MAKTELLPLATLVVGGAAFGLAVWSGMVASGNRDMRLQAVERQNQIMQGAETAQINGGVIQLLARAAQQTGDQDILLLLQANGVPIGTSATPPPSAGNGPAPADPAAPKE